MKPPQDYTKCNADCTFFSNNFVKGIGLCFKDHTGQFIFASTAWSAPKVTVKEAEAIGILKALHIAHSISIPQVRFETDSNCAVNAINSSSIMPYELGGIVSKCRSILSEHWLQGCVCSETSQ